MSHGSDFSRRLASLLGVVAALSACTDPTPSGVLFRASSSTTTVSVTSAAPDSTLQDTTLNVHVFGAGFDRGSKAQWAQNGVPSPDVTTNSTQFVSSTELLANVTVAVTASPGSYDIAVTTSHGVKGIGTELFTISSRPVTSVTVTPTALTMASTSTYRLTATTYDHAGKVLTGRFVTWSTSNTAVATVSSTGLVTAQSAGTATITATSEGVSGTSAITVTAIPSGSLVFSALTAGSTHTCGIAGGAAYCWGYNADGQIGNGSTSDATLPASVSGGLSFTALSAGYWATCGIASSGPAFCWGANVTGLFGDGSQTNSLTPVPAASGLALAAVYQGDQHTCGLTSGGIAYCWGGNHYGQLGIGSTTDSPGPVAVSGGRTFATISTSGPADHTCGLTPGGSAYCWGLNQSGQIGAPTSGVCTLPLSRKSTVPCALAPVAVSGGLAFTAVSVGYSHTCALTAGGAAYCWGDNSNGELGDGTTTNRSAPVAVAGGLTFTTLSVGLRASCGVAPSGAAYCWGSNAHGDLGDGTNVTRSIPVPVLGGINFATVGVGAGQVCGLTSGGTIYCWGENLRGQLGNGTTTDSYSPVKVAAQP
jgi:alpha-tubulin suppressor-like RCC1 family protein